MLDSDAFHYSDKSCLDGERVHSETVKTCSCFSIQNIDRDNSKVVKLINMLFIAITTIIWLTDFACCDWSIPGP